MVDLYRLFEEASVSLDSAILILCKIGLYGI